MYLNKFGKTFSHTLCYLSELLSLNTCKQRADYLTPMMWFDFIRWRFHFIRRLFHNSNYIKYNQNDVIQNYISSETHNWYVYTIWEIETQNLWFTQMPSQGEMGGRKKCACLGTHKLFVEQPVVSLSLYNGATQCTRGTHLILASWLENCYKSFQKPLRTQFFIIFKLTAWKISWTCINSLPGHVPSMADNPYQFLPCILYFWRE